MGKTSRKKYTPEVKAQVAIEALKEQPTLAELAKKYEVSPAMISHWKAHLLTESPLSMEVVRPYNVPMGKSPRGENYSTLQF